MTHQASNIFRASRHVDRRYVVLNFRSRHLASCRISCNVTVRVHTHVCTESVRLTRLTFRSIVYLYSSLLLLPFTHRNILFISYNLQLITFFIISHIHDSGHGRQFIYNRDAYITCSYPHLTEFT